ncbi:MAG: hypothetical protein ACR5KW_02755 [Wolbachia sp.]
MLTQSNMCHSALGLKQTICMSLYSPFLGMKIIGSVAITEKLTSMNINSISIFDNTP